MLIKLEFSASIGFVQKESVTIHGHKILRVCDNVCVVMVGSSMLSLP
jgi:DsbC/DsbD-like thiol-disulfide interchange protein